MEKRRDINLAIIGTFSLKGRELKNTLENKNLPIKKIRFLDPEVKEEYSHLTDFKGEAQIIQSVKEENLYNMDIVFFTSDSETSKKYCSLAQQYNFRAIDLSGTFNAQKEIPLVVAGVNDSILNEENYIIANPHPLAIILSAFLHSLQKNFVLNRILVVAFQPASEYEKSGIDELMDQSIGFLNLSKIPKKIFKEQIAFNLISRVGKLEKDGFTDIERTVVKEIKRILSKDTMPLSLSLIQAPIFHTYSLLAFIEFKDSPTIPEIENIFRKSSIFEVTSPDETPPSPVSIAGKDKIYIGQIKKDNVFSNSFWFWLVADNLTRGSVLNAVEVAEKLISIKFPAIDK